MLKQLFNRVAYFTLRESVLMDKEVFFLLEDDDPHLLFLEAGCPSVGVLGSEVPLTQQFKYCTVLLNTTH